MRRIFIAAIALLGCSSGNNTALVGKWSATISPQSGSTPGIVFSFNSDGTTSYALSGTGMCTGSMSYSGQKWTSTSTTIAFSGTTTCSGMGITCPSGNLTCSSTGPSGGSCTYTVTGSSLTLTCDAPNDSLNATYAKVQ